MNEDVFPVENGDFPMSFVSFEKKGCFPKGLKDSQNEVKMGPVWHFSDHIAGWKMYHPF